MSETRPRRTDGGAHSDIKVGDILIKHNSGGIVGYATVAGQLVGRGPSEYTHAAIASTTTQIIEMSGSGIAENSLLIKNANLVYDVFRCYDQDIAVGAAETAKMMLAGVQANNMKINYDSLGALTSIWSQGKLKGKVFDMEIELKNLMSGGGAMYFCSGHVVLCYQAAMAQTASMAAQGVFPVQDAAAIFTRAQNCYQPAYLWKILHASSQFKFVGTCDGVRRRPY